MLQELKVWACKVTKVIWASTDPERGLTQSHSVKGSKMRNGEVVRSCGLQGSARDWSHISHEDPFPETTLPCNCKSMGTLAEIFLSNDLAFLQ